MNKFRLRPVEKDEPQEKLLITVKEAALLMATGKQTIYAMIHAGRLPYIRLGPQRGYRIPLSALRDWIDDEGKAND